MPTVLGGAPRALRGGGYLPQAARHYGRLPAVMQDIALRAMSLRDGILVRCSRRLQVVNIVSHFARCRFATVFLRAAPDACMEFRTPCDVASRRYSV